jgi:hypothetical protein
MRFRLRAGERSAKYQPGQLVSAAYAARYPHKVAPQRKVRAKKKPKAAPLKKLPRVVEEPMGYDWDISMTYMGEEA